MSDVDILKLRRAYVKGTIRLKDMFEPEAAASAPSETVFFFFFFFDQ